MRGPLSPVRNAPGDIENTGTYGRVNMNPATPPSDGMAAGSHVGRLVSHFTGASSATFSAQTDDGDLPLKPSPALSASHVRRQITGGSGWAVSRSTTPLKGQHTGSATAAVLPQMTGGGLPITRAVRSHSVLGVGRPGGTGPIKAQWTGSSTSESASGNPLSPQATGGGLFVNRPRPKSVLGSRGGLGSSHRGMQLVRQMTGGDW
jgi:hypothetical protein